MSGHHLARAYLPNETTIIIVSLPQASPASSPRHSMHEGIRCSARGATQEHGISSKMRKYRSRQRRSPPYKVRCLHISYQVHAYGYRALNSVVIRTSPSLLCTPYTTRPDQAHRHGTCRPCPQMHRGSDLENSLVHIVATSRKPYEQETIVSCGQGCSCTTQ